MHVPSHLPGRGRDARQVWLVLLVGVLADQATKALAHDHVVNRGGTGSLLPHAVRMLWAHAQVGAALDLLDVVPLAGLLLLALRARDADVRIGVSLVLAGAVSNWADRLGLSALTQPGSPRGAVDWVRLPGWPDVWNLADGLIVAGGLLLAVAGLRRWVPRRPLLVGTACLCLLAVWVGVWSGDRRAEESTRAARQLRQPVVAAERQLTELEARVRHAQGAALAEEVRTARAALTAREAGRADAQSLLPSDAWFVCSAQRRCVVVRSAGSALSLVYPLRRPPWGRSGLPPGICDTVSDQVHCESALLGTTTAGPA